MIFSTMRAPILLHKNPTDLRLGFDGLHKLAKRSLQNPRRGQYFIFVNRRRTSCKVYTMDRTGEVLVCKRLSSGVFCRPNPSYKKQIRLSGSEFSQFFEGLNVAGRILESVPYARSGKKRLPFVPPYTRLMASDARSNSNSRTSSTLSPTE